MTDETRGIGGTVGPPWSVDVLADLHAGVLDEAQAAELWPLVNADPDARAILDALDATRADLASLADAPVEPMPAEFAARLDAALAAEAASRPAATFRESAEPKASQQAGSGHAKVVDFAAARRRRNQRLGWGAGVLTAAAAAVVAVAVLVPGAKQDGPPNVAAPPPSGPSVGSDGSGAQALLGKTLGVRDFGPLQTEQRLDQCIAAYGLDTKIRPVGVRPVNVDGKSAILTTFTTGKLAQYRLIAFGADCGTGDPAVLFDKIVGEK